MTREFNYNLRGMYRRSGQLGNKLDMAYNVQNMEKSLENKWMTRKGSIEIATGTVIDASRYVRGNKVIYLKATGPSERSGVSLVDFNAGGNAPSNWTVPVSFAEYSGVLYWTDPANANYLWKFDGYMHYRAGVPKAAGTTAAGAGTKYYRVVILFEDLQGNVTWGDYVQFDLKAAGATFTMDSLNNTQFWTKYAQSNAVQVINSGSPSIAVLAGHNYVANDYVRIRDSVTGVYTVMKVSSVGATSVTLDFTANPGATFSYGAGEPVERRCYFAIFISDTPTYGYYLDSYHFVRSNTATNNITSTGATTTPMEDLYDTTDIKGLPPKMSYICIYNNLMVMANRTNADTIDANAGVPRDIDTFAWSNLLLGSSVETFAPFDEQVVGKTDEGGIAGVFGGDYSLVILKKKQVYFISGTLTGGNFSIINALTNGVGCSYHKSIVEMEGGCIFMSYKGVYLAAGQKVKEMSDGIEPFITANSWDFNLEACRAVAIPARETIYFFLPASSQANDIILLYNYYWKEWSYHYGRSARNGFVQYNDDLVWVHGTSIKTEQDPFNDDGAAIDSFWESQFLDLGKPSLVKKFTKLVLLSITTSQWTAYFKTFVNWDSATLSTDTTAPVLLGRPIDVPLVMDKCYSLKLKIGCNTVNQQAVIGGIEQVVEAVQFDVKGDR